MEVDKHDGGGNSEVMNPLVEALRKRPALRKRGTLFVLTGPHTFSSGLLNAWGLRKRFKATVAGEPSAQRPNSYGDVRNFVLPNSNLRVDYCTKYFRLVPGDPERLEIDLRVELTSRDYFAGRDAVLERVLAGEGRRSSQYGTKRPDVASLIAGQGALAGLPALSAPEASFVTCKNAITGTNWEGVGVTPDITIAADKAVPRAVAEALKTLAERSSNRDDKARFRFIAAGFEAMSAPQAPPPGFVNQ